MFEFVVKAIEKTYNGIQLTLSAHVPPPPPSPEEEAPAPPQIDPLETIIPETDEEKVMLKMLKSLRKFGVDLFPAPLAPMPAPRLAYVSKRESKIDLTDEEYAEIGKPGLAQKIKLTIAKVDE